MGAATSLPFFRPSPAARRTGFTLVEVTLALGIVAVALLPLIGLLSVGLNSYQNANLRGPAAQAVSQIASCLRLATADVDSSGKPTGGYTATSPLGATVKWMLDGKTASYPLYYDQDGNLTTLAGGKRAQLAAMLVLTAPKRASGAFTSGMAQIAVAWPAVAAPTYSGGTGPGGTIGFTNPQGHEEATIAFGPDAP